MSLNKTLDRLFDEIRREAKRNPDFANRLDAVLRLHDSRRELTEEVMADVEGDGETQAPSPPVRARRNAKVQKPPPAAPPADVEPPSLNPVGVYKRDGEGALAAALGAQDEDTLRAIVAEHNLDPSGQTDAMDRDSLAAHVLAQAKRRAERDEKLFDY